MTAHAPVLLDEVLSYLDIAPDGCFLDGTFGRGGHSRAILARLGERGRLLAMDRDPAAVRVGKELQLADPRLTIEQNNFGQLRSFVEEQGLLGKLQGILLDLGVSSPQLDEAERGFSFRSDGPLDMRMDPHSSPSAADWLNAADEAEITKILSRLGEEREARRIARAIVRARPIETTRQLAGLVESVVRPRPGAKRLSPRHPATKTFQAVRMHINRELEELQSALDAATDALAPGGRLCVISFHSLEDRMVKRFLRDQSRVDPALARLPVVPESSRPRWRIVTKPIRSGEKEVDMNPRARSATLRVGELLQ